MPRKLPKRERDIGIGYFLVKRKSSHRNISMISDRIISPSTAKIPPVKADVVGSCISEITNPRWRSIAILEVHKQVYLDHYLADLHQIWFAELYILAHDAY